MEAMFDSPMMGMMGRDISLKLFSVSLINFIDGLLLFLSLVSLSSI